MRAPLASIVLVLAAAILPAWLSGCATPSPDKFVSGGSTQGGTGAGLVSVGMNAAGEACTAQSEGKAGTYVYCGTWDQPSGLVVQLGPGDAGRLSEIAAASAWRSGLDARFTCDAPSPTTVLNGNPALVMNCTRKIGGWPHVAFVALIDNQVWGGDGVASALPAVDQALGVTTGLRTAGAAQESAQTDALSARRLASQALSSGDIGQYEKLMSLGARANLAGNYPAAEEAYRAALSLQQKALGANSPNTSTPLMHLALQLSDEGRYSEAQALFQRADALVRDPSLSDKDAAPRLLHYRGLDALNQGKPAEALTMLAAAERGYASLAPPETVEASAPEHAAGSYSSDRGAAVLVQQVSDEELFADPIVTNAVVGLVETRRAQAVALRALGRLDDSARADGLALGLAEAKRLALPALYARLQRTSGVLEDQQGRTGDAVTQLSEAAENFARALPGSRPLGVTELLRAAGLARQQRSVEALAACNTAVDLFRKLKAGVDPTLMQPCLSIYAARTAAGGPDAQALLAQMFEAAQLAQGSITGQQIAQASALLAENARDPRVAEAIRRRDTANQALDDLYRDRDELAANQQAGGPAPSADASAGLDKNIAAAVTAAADADAALQEASPNYGQLVQQVVDAKDVLAALQPHEAFVATVVDETGGWTFLLHDGRIDVAPIDGGAAKIDGLVKRVRSAMDSDQEPLPAFDVEAARQLYAAVFGGVQDRMGDVTAMTVAPAGALLSIPFSILLTGAAQPDDLGHAPWLIRKMTIAHVPAAANFVTLRKVAGTSRATQPWFGFGDFVPVTLRQAEKSFPSATCGDSARLLAGLPPLPGAGAELDAARKILGASPQDELLGPAFTAAQAERMPLTDMRVLHFATHALLPTDLACQDEPAIVTSAPRAAPDASGALLTASAVARMKLDADLVILSACNTGGPGGGAAGESLSGLARSFFFAGARALLITHWPVNDRFTAYLMALTLSGMQQHPDQGISEALRSAQLRALDEAVGPLAIQAHPFYWAPLALIGEGGAAQHKSSVASLH